MTQKTTLSRLQRLERITAQLKSDETVIVDDIAREVGVSPRTISRDIQILRDQGLPIDADRGRGGGVRLHWSWGIGRLNLTHTEAIDLLVSLAVTEQMKSPLFMANLSSVRRKLMASFSPSTKHKLNQLKKRILIGESASPFVLSAFAPPKTAVVKILHEAFLVAQTLHLRYRAENDRTTERVIEPHYLLLSYPVWYVLAWDHLRRDIRSFRCDRIVHAKLNGNPFRVRPLGDFQTAIDGVSAIQP